MADRETIIAGGDNSSGAIVAIVLVVVLAIGAYFLFFNGRPLVEPSGGSVTVEAPTINVPAPQTPAPTGN